MTKHLHHQGYSEERRTRVKSNTHREYIEKLSRLAPKSNLRKKKRTEDTTLLGQALQGVTAKTLRKRETMIISFLALLCVCLARQFSSCDELYYGAIHIGFSATTSDTTEDEKQVPSEVLSMSAPIEFSYNNSDYQVLLDKTLKSLPDVKTASHAKKFFAGLCNQIQRFIGLNILAREEGFSQVDEIVEESIVWKDTFGQGCFVPHKMLWDVVHWNSFFPTLPRLTSYDKGLYPDLDTRIMDSFTFNGKKYITKEVYYNVTWDIFNKSFTTQPPPLGENPNQAKNRFFQLHKRIERDRAQWDTPKLLKIYTEAIKGALRPHPFLQQIVNASRIELGAKEKGYMVIHLRVEPDMAEQQNCAHRKVFNVAEIVNMIYAKYPEPPVSTVLIQFSRALMEEGANNSLTGKLHDMTVGNLNEINRLLKEGMWNGTVKVVEAGSRMVEETGDPFYSRYSNIAGGIVNLFLAINSDIFIGTEVSTYSTLAINSRFYREQRDNYFYRPEGLYWVTPHDRTKPHRFIC